MWNLQHRRLFTAMGRMLFFIVATLQSGLSLFSKDFWQALIYPYASVTFEEGHQEAKRKKIA